MISHHCPRLEGLMHGGLGLIRTGLYVLYV